MRDELLREAHARTVTAVAQAIRDSFGNLPLPEASVEVFISAESERLGALLSHDLEMFLLRLVQDSVPTVWPSISDHEFRPRLSMSEPSGTACMTCGIGPHSGPQSG